MSKFRLGKSRSAMHAFVVASVAVVSLALVFGASAVRAQNYYARTFAVSGFAGYNIASDIYTSSTGSGRLELKNGLTFGGRATAFLKEYAAFEFAYSRVEADLELKGYAGTIPSGFDPGTLDADEFDFNFLFSQPAPNPKFWPYFTIGLGWTNTHPNVTAVNPLTMQTISLDGNSLFAFNFGIGTLVELGNPKLALRLDARWRVTDTDITTSSSVYCDYWGYCWAYSSSWYNSGELTGGLTYRFGTR